MTKPVAVLFADSHLSPGAWPSRGAIHGDSYFALSCIVDLAVRHGVDLVGAGDLLDRQENRSEPVVEFYRQLDRLQDAGLWLKYGQGQHELETVPWLSGHPAAQHYHKQYFKLGPFNCHGLDYCAAGTLQEQLAAIEPDTQILFAHQVWAEHMGSIASPQGGMADVPVVPVVFSGDFHVYAQTQAIGKDAQSVLLISPGSTCMQAINEPADKYCVVLYDDFTFQPVALPSRPVVDWQPLTTVMDLDELVSTVKDRLSTARLDAINATDWSLPEPLTKPLLRVTYSSELLDTVRRVGAVVGNDAFIFYKEVPPQDTETVSSETLAAVGTGRAVTLETALPHYLAGKQMEDLEATALRLLQAEDVDGELSRIREESINES